jgi:DNA uptake protein ComE-like DNA-binding protein
MNLVKTILVTIFTITLLGTSLGLINAADTKDKSISTSEVQKTPTKKQLLDINTATPSELKELPGISDAHAKKIVDSRPYNRKIELVQKQIIPQATFDKIKDRIVAKKPSTDKK